MMRRHTMLTSALALTVLAAPALAVSPKVPEADAAATEAEPAMKARVERAAFTTAIVDREPQDSVQELAIPNDPILYFSEVRDATGEHAGRDRPVTSLFLDEFLSRTVAHHLVGVSQDDLNRQGQRLLAAPFAVLPL